MMTDGFSGRLHYVCYNIFNILYSISLQNRCLCSYKVPSGKRCNNLIKLQKSGETSGTAVYREALAGGGPRARYLPSAHGADPMWEGQREKFPLP